MPKDILAFVGSSGVGKTMLMRELLAAMPEKAAACMSVTTRPPRGSDEHDSMYRFTSREDFEQRIANGAFIHWVRHAGNYYGTQRTDANEVLCDRYAIGAFLEQGVQNLRAGGYTVRVIKVRPVGPFVPNEPARREEDAAREKIDVHPEITITNDFAQGGRERAIGVLLAYVRALS